MLDLTAAGEGGALDLGDLGVGHPPLILLVPDLLHVLDADPLLLEDR
ncbi:hypothetical protein [Kineococcus sp. R86509]